MREIEGLFVLRQARGKGVKIETSESKTRTYSTGFNIGAVM
ncbi:MAG: hypothetical protein WA240_03980 [Nitrospirota bacterium]